jgi:hypothetical protein
MDVPCAAMRDRHDPEMMRCVGCRIYWEVSYPEFTRGDQIDESLTQNPAG